MLLPIKRIVCPTDFSEPSYKGVEAANALAVSFKAALTLVNVVTPVHPVSAAGVPATYKITEYYDEMTQLARDHLDKLVAEKISHELDVQKTILTGNAAEEIVKLAESSKANIIVIATHGWTGWRHLVFGSVAERVVRLAGCPVITIPSHPE